MSESLLLQSSFIFENSNLIDCIRQSCIDLEYPQDEEDIQDFLNESKNYLDKDLQNDVLIELTVAIISCFKNYSTNLMPFLDELLKNVKKNENYILLTSNILAYLTNSQLKISLPDYRPFVSSALNDILLKIQDDQKLIIFDHEIDIKFKNDLIINLLLSSNLTEKLYYDFFPFLLTTNLTKNNQNFELLLKKLNQSNLGNTILPQTSYSNNELFELITTKNFQLISKMSKNAFSPVATAIVHTKSGSNDEIEGLSKETVLQFVSVISIFVQKYHVNIVFDKNLTDLINEGVNQFKSENLNVITASIDEILSNSISSLIDDLYNGKYNSNKTIILDSIFKLSDNNHSSIFNFLNRIQNLPKQTKFKHL